MSDLTDHARRELDLAGVGDPDADYGGALKDAVLEIIEKFAEQGHSGASAGMVAAMVGKLMRFEPLAPLTGEDHEWNHVADDTWQNNRCSHVFKSADGAYDIDGRIFVEPNGSAYTSRDSRVPVTFPYTPKREYVEVPEPEADR